MWLMAAMAKTNDENGGGGRGTWPMSKNQTIGRILQRQAGRQMQVRVLEKKSYGHLGVLRMDGTEIPENTATS